MAEPLHPGHDLQIVEASLLELAAELHPEPQTEDYLLSRILSKEAESLEIEVAKKALSNLVEFGVLHRGEGESLQITQPALRSVLLLS